MQITLDVPDNVPPALLQQYIDEFQIKLKRLVGANRTEREINRRHNLLMNIIQRKTCQTMPVSKEELSQY